VESHPFDSALSKLRLRIHYFQQDTMPRVSCFSVGQRPMGTQGRLFRKVRGRMGHPRRWGVRDCAQGWSAPLGSRGERLDASLGVSDV